jgi:hypothetical protein
MRRALTVIAMVSLLGLAACGGSSGSGTGSSGDATDPSSVSPSDQVDVGNGITDPINRARDVVGQQNSQLQQEEQQTGSGDPTSP